MNKFAKISVRYTNHYGKKMLLETNRVPLNNEITALRNLYPEIDDLKEIDFDKNSILFNNTMPLIIFYFSEFKDLRQMVINALTSEDYILEEEEHYWSIFRKAIDRPDILSNNNNLGMAVRLYEKKYLNSLFKFYWEIFEYRSELFKD